jgi:hypothetical protein
MTYNQSVRRILWRLCDILVVSPFSDGEGYPPCRRSQAADRPARAAFSNKCDLIICRFRTSHREVRSNLAVGSDMRKQKPSVIIIVPINHMRALF